MPPLNPNQYRRTGGSNLEVPLNPIRYDNSGRVNADFENLIDRSVGTGDVLEQEFRDVGPAFWNQYNRYRDIGDDAYEGLLTGEAGYTPEEAGRILDLERLSDFEYGPGEANELYMTPEEQAAIAGDPFAAFAYRNPELLRGHANDFRDRGRDVLSEAGGRSRGYLDNAQLGVDPSAAARIRAAIAATSGDTAIDETGLRLREGFLDDFQMSDEEVGDLADLGARTASGRWDSAYADIDRRAAAAGTMSPGALAVLREDLDRKSNIDAADASTRATLEGKGLQRELLGKGEDMRLGSEQFITGANLDRGFRLGDMRLASEEGLEDRRYRGERDRLDAGVGLEMDLAGKKLSHETNVGDVMTGTERYLQDTGTGLHQWADDTRSGRNAELSAGRRGAAQTGQQLKRDFGFGVSDRASGRAGQVADTRIGQEQAGRDYVERQGQFAGGMYQNAANRRVDAATGMTNAQLGGSADRRQRRGPGFWERITFGLAG